MNGITINDKQYVFIATREEDDCIDCDKCNLNKDGYNIVKLKFAMDFLGITSVELTYNPEKAGNEFVLSEDVRIRLMPMLYDRLIPCDATVNLAD